MPDPLFPELIDARLLAQQVRLLRRWFRLLPLGEAVFRLQTHSLPARAACLTFEHGHATHADVVLPVLQHYAVAATFFVASDYLDGACLWTEAVADVVRRAQGPRLCLGRSGFGRYDIGSPARRRSAIESLLAALRELAPAERQARVASLARHFESAMLDADRVLALHRAGMEIGAHPASDAALGSLPNGLAHSEIACGRARLQEIIQAPVRLFAYPGGTPGRDFKARHANMLRSQGFDAAVSCAAGAARVDTDLFQLPRWAPQRRNGATFLLQMTRNLCA
ncbi:MAG: polysaccharide deacetylase family protein [Pseudomonadota bacterium]